MRLFENPLSILAVAVGLLLATVDSANSQDIGGEPAGVQYTVTVADTIVLGEPMQVAIGYQNASFRAETVEHPKTVIFDFVLTRIDVAAKDAPTWSSRHDGRLVAYEENGILAWAELPAEMVTVAGRSSVQETFDLQALLDLAAIDPGRYRVTVSWGDGANAESADAVFDLVVEPSGASEKYLRHLAVEGNPVEQRWAKEKLESGGARR